MYLREGIYERNTNFTILQLWKMRYEDENKETGEMKEYF